MNLTERYFSALGWRPFYHAVLGLSHFITPEQKRIEVPEELPNITQHYPDFKKFVVEEMEKRGITYFIKEHKFFWGKEWDVKDIYDEVANKPIKNNEILEAAVEAACEYLEGEKPESQEV